jgi:hypothetical protein
MIIPHILANTHRLASSPSYNRLAAQVLRVLSPLLPSSHTHVQIQQQISPAEHKGKKRARYEGDELFSLNSTPAALNPSSNELYMAALSGLAALLPSLPRTTQATIQRTLLMLLLHLPRLNAQRLALEVGRVYGCTLGEGASGTLGVEVQALKSIEDASFILLFL